MPSISRSCCFISSRVASRTRPAAMSSRLLRNSMICRSMRRTWTLRSGLVISAKSRTACEMEPRRALLTVVSPSTISRTNRSVRSEWGDRRYLRRPLSVSVSSQRFSTQSRQCSAGVRFPCHLGSRASETLSWNHSAETDPSTCWRCSANRGRTQSLEYALSSVRVGFASSAVRIRSLVASMTCQSRRSSRQLSRVCRSPLTDSVLRARCEPYG